MASYKITKKGNGFFVENAATRRVLGHHKTLADARKQVRDANNTDASTRGEMARAVKVHMSGNFGKKAPMQSDEL